MNANIERHQLKPDRARTTFIWIHLVDMQHTGDYVISRGINEMICSDQILISLSNEVYDKKLFVYRIYWLCLVSMVGSVLVLG